MVSTMTTSFASTRLSGTPLRKCQLISLSNFAPRPATGRQAGAFVVRADQELKGEAQASTIVSSTHTALLEKEADPLAPPTQSAQDALDASPVPVNGSAKSPAEAGLSMWEAMRFDGPAPELINGRLAMLGAFSGIVAKLVSGASAVDQINIAPGPIAATFALIIAATLIPVVRGTPDFVKKGNYWASGKFTTTAEMLNGRVAMLGIAAYVAFQGIGSL